mgnify:CR=1 FL=1
MNESEQEELEKIKKECLAYFGQSLVMEKSSEKAFEKNTALMERFGGKVVLKNLKSQDIEELEGFFGKSFHGQKSVTVSAEKIPAGTGSKPLQKYDTGMAVRKHFSKNHCLENRNKNF